MRALSQPLQAMAWPQQASGNTVPRRLLGDRAVVRSCALWMRGWHNTSSGATGNRGVRPVSFAQFCTPRERHDGHDRCISRSDPRCRPGTPTGHVLGFSRREASTFSPIAQLPFFVLFSSAHRDIPSGTRISFLILRFLLACCPTSVILRPVLREMNVGVSLTR